MGVSLPVITDLNEAIARLGEAAVARKCWQCGCLHQSLDAIEKALPVEQRPPALTAVLNTLQGRRQPLQYECLGCEVCYPPLAMNALGIEDEACPAEAAKARAGWPPLPGAYTVLRFTAPVAICTLADDALAAELARKSASSVAIVGPMYTENLGIERVISNIIANPNIRFLIVCGRDSQQKIGHLSGQSLLALAQNGMDAAGRIIGAKGKRPVLRNIRPDAVEHFRKSVQVIDLVGTMDAEMILKSVGGYAAMDTGPAEPFAAVSSIPVIRGEVPEKMTSDPAGYFVIFPDRGRHLLVLEHYQNDGVLDAIIEAREAAEAYFRQLNAGCLCDWTMQHTWVGNWPGRNGRWRTVSPMSRMPRQSERAWSIGRGRVDVKILRAAAGRERLASKFAYSSKEQVQWKPRETTVVVIVRRSQRHLRGNREARLAHVGRGAPAAPHLAAKERR